jgi:hypothetical protein
MVPSSAIAITVHGKHLAYGGFSLSEAVCHGNYEFITDYFSGLSLSPRRGNEGAFLWAQFIVGRLPHSGPRSRAPPRSSLLQPARKEASATLPSNSAARGPCLPPLQPQHGRRTLQPRQGFPYRRRSHSQKPTTPPSGITLAMKSN